MARSTDRQDAAVPKGRIAQLRAVFTMTRKADPASVWWMFGALIGCIVAGYLIGLAFNHEIYFSILGLMAGVLAFVIILGRRAERAAFLRIADQKGAVGYALKGLRRDWTAEEQPVAVDPRTQDLVFRAVGRPGVVLVTEGPVPRVNRIAESERKRLIRIFPDVPVTVVNAGDAEGQISLRGLSRHLMRKKPVLTKTEVAEVSKRLRALGAARAPIPKGMDPTRMRPDRKATKGR